MKKSKVFLLGSTVLLAMGSLTMTACGLEELFGTTSGSDSGSSSDSSSSGTGDKTTVDDDFSIKDEELEEGMVRGKDTSFTVSINGLQAYYTPSDIIEWDSVTLTLTYDDLTMRTLECIEYDANERTSEETEFVLYTDGLYELSTTGQTITEGTYSLSYRIYLEEDYTDEDGARQTQLAMYRGAPVNQSSIVIAARPTQQYRIYSYSAPTLQETYEKNVAESVSEEGGSENEDKFYEEPEYYEVGDDNPFTYKPRLIWMNRETNVLENPDSFNVDFTVYHYIEATQSNEILDLDNNEYVSVNGFDFQFTEKADEEVFTITASLSDFTTDMTNNPLPTYSFTVKVHDGWNVYDELDLGRMNLTSDDFDVDFQDLETGGSTAKTGSWWSSRERNYEAYGRAFFEWGTPDGYQIYANHYWVDASGEPCSDYYDLLYTDPNDPPADGDHMVYSLTHSNRIDRSHYDSDEKDYATNRQDERYAYRVKTDEFWYNFLAEKGRTDLHQINGIFIHTDLNITEDCLPPEFLLSSEEASQLGPNSADGLSAWGAEVAIAIGPLLKVSETGDAYEYEDMEGSIRDRAFLYSHHMEDDFILNGNLFTIDASKLKWSMNNVFMAQMNFYYTQDTEFAIQGNASFFQFDYNREATSPTHNSASSDLYHGVPSCLVSNIRYKGNSRGYTEADTASGVRSGRQITNAEFASGCLSFLVSTSTEVDVDNVIVTNANIAFFASRVHQNDDIFAFNINHAKVYDCYTTAFYLWCSGNTRVENSEFKRFGGPFSICISTFADSKGLANSSGMYYYPSDFSSVDANGNVTSTHTPPWDSTLYLGSGVTIESFVGGSESWFVLNNATSVVTQVKGYDYLLNRAGKTMIASNDPEDDNYGKFNLKSIFMDTTYILSGSSELHGSVIDENNYWSSEGGYAIDYGSDTEMQHYIDSYAKWYSIQTGTKLLKKVYTDVATPVIFTNTGNVFGFASGDDMISTADPVGDNAVLYDLKEYDSTGTKTAAQFDENDTELFMVIPLHADLGDTEGNSITVDFYDLCERVIAEEYGISLGYTTIKIAVDLLALFDDSFDVLGDDLSAVPLGNLLRLDWELTISGYTIKIVVGMGDTLLGVVMDLYDYEGQ